MGEKKPRNRIGWVLLRFTIAFIAYILAQALTFLAFDFSLSQTNPILSVVSGVLATAGILAFMIGLLYCYLRFVEHRPLADIGLPHLVSSLSRFGIGLSLGVAGILLASVPLYLLRIYALDFSNVAVGLSLSSWSWWSTLAFFVVVGVGEELLTRGALQHGLLRLGPLPAVMITALLFSLLHLANPGVTILSLLNIFLAGMTMGILVFATKNIWASIGMHITWNWTQGNILGIPVSGTNSGESLFRTTILSKNSLLSGGAFGLEGTITCTIVLVCLSLLFHWIAIKNGGYQHYKEIGVAQKASAAKK